MNPLVVSEFGAGLSVNHWRLCLRSKLTGELGEYEARRFPFDSVIFLTHRFSVSGEALRFLYAHNVPAFVIEIPRRTNSDELARLLKISNASFVMERRRAERRLLAGLLGGEKTGPGSNWV